MRVALDANVLIRLIVADDSAQHQIVLQEISQAERLFIPTVALCETVWVLSRLYRYTKAEIALALEHLLGVENVEYDADAVEAGLIMLRSGGDFADAVIALEGTRLGAETLVTFDQDAVRRLAALGVSARLAGAQA